MNKRQSELWIWTFWFYIQLSNMSQQFSQGYQTECSFKHCGVAVAVHQHDITDKKVWSVQCCCRLLETCSMFTGTDLTVPGHRRGRAIMWNIITVILSSKAPLEIDDTVWQISHEQIDLLNILHFVQDQSEFVNVILLENICPDAAHIVWFCYYSAIKWSVLTSPHLRFILFIYAPS